MAALIQCVYRSHRENSSYHGKTLHLETCTNKNNVEFLVCSLSVCAWTPADHEHIDINSLLISDMLAFFLRRMLCLPC